MPRLQPRNLIPAIALFGVLIASTSNPVAAQAEAFPAEVDTFPAQNSGSSTDADIFPAEDDAFTAPVAQPQGSALSANYVTAGTAYSLDTGQVLYRELYTALDSNKTVRVDYMSPNGKTFATKILSYHGEPFQPAMKFQDTRDNEVIAAEFEGARLVLTHGKNTSKRQEVIHDNAQMVIDTGFDAFIQLNWSRLLDGKRVKFDFAMPTRLASTQLEVRKMRSGDSPVYNDDIGSHWVYFKITSAQKLKSLLAEPIYLAYEPNGKYLMRYQGRSNIDDDKGRPVDVRIEYEYIQ